MAYGQFDAGSGSSDFNYISFLIQQAMLKMQTVTLVKVIAVHGGGVAPTGTVDVQPMVNQTTGDNVAVAHGTIYGVPFFRAQGGANAVIVDPVAGDIGMACFASRDISSVKSTKAVANPGSKRVFDWADGLYVGGFVNISPTQYIKFDGSGITIVSPTKVTVQAPSVDVEATGTVKVNAPTVTIEGGGTSIDAKTFLTHTHTGVQSGGSNSGPVT